MPDNSLISLKLTDKFEKIPPPAKIMIYSALFNHSLVYLKLSSLLYSLQGGASLSIILSIVSLFCFG